MATWATVAPLGIGDCPQEVHQGQVLRAVVPVESRRVGTEVVGAELPSALKWPLISPRLSTP